MKTFGLCYLILLSLAYLLHGKMTVNISINEHNIMGTLTTPQFGKDEIEESTMKDSGKIKESIHRRDKATSSDLDVLVDPTTDTAVDAHKGTLFATASLETNLHVSSMDGPEVTTETKNTMRADSAKYSTVNDMPERNKHGRADSIACEMCYIENMEKSSENKEPLMGDNFTLTMHKTDNPVKNKYEGNSAKMNRYDYIRRYLIASGYMTAMQDIPPGLNFFIR